MTSQVYTLPELAAAAEIEYRTAYVWLQRGLIRASVATATGSGTTNEFDEADVLEARILADLRRLGAEMTVLERTAAALRGQAERLGGNQTLIINGRVDIVPTDQVAARIAVSEPSFVYRADHAMHAMQTSGIVR